MSRDTVVAPSGRKTTTKADQLFAGSSCRFLSYRWKFKKDEFDAAVFLKAARDSAKGKYERIVTCAPKSKGSDYHLHVSWKPTKLFSLSVKFAKGATEPEVDEREPFAEEFTTWVEEFFIRKVSEAEVHAEFIYRAGSRQSRFLLPFRASIGPYKDVEIDGMSFNLPAEPEGIGKIWLTMRPRSIWVHLAGERTVDIRKFNPKSEIAALSAVVSTVLEETRP